MVIVVVAILAAISVVVYRGIQQRAIQSKLEITARTVEKKVQFKKVIDCRASPTISLSTVQATRQHFDISSSSDDVAVLTLGPNR